MEILPFTDATVVLEMTGADLWTALESGLGQWPAQQGYVLAPAVTLGHCEFLI